VNISPGQDVYNVHRLNHNSKVGFHVWQVYKSSTKRKVHIQKIHPGRALPAGARLDQFIPPANGAIVFCFLSSLPFLLRATRHCLAPTCYLSALK
jgi:hypothetical protein